MPISKAPIAQQQRQYVKGVFSAGANPARSTNFMKIIVSTEQEKIDLLKASKYIHDLRNLDISNDAVNTIAHLYLAPFLIEVNPNHT